MGSGGNNGGVFGAQVVVECGECGDFEVVFVGGIEGIAGEDFDEFFEAVEAAVVAHLGSGNLTGFGRDGLDGGVGVGIGVYFGFGGGACTLNFAGECFGVIDDLIGDIGGFEGVDDACGELADGGIGKFAGRDSVAVGSDCGVYAGD